MYSVYNVDRLACVLLHFSSPIVMIMLKVIVYWYYDRYIHYNNRPQINNGTLARLINVFCFNIMNKRTQYEHCGVLSI